MNQRLKRSLTYVILLLFLFNSMGYYIVFELNKYLVKKEMQSFLRSNKDPLIVLKISDPATNPDFSRPDAWEIIYQGKLYDVVREVKTGKTSCFYCQHDTLEEMLIAGFKRMVKSKFNQHLLDHVIKIALTRPSLTLHQLVLQKISYPNLSITFTSHHPAPFSPPPEG